MQNRPALFISYRRRDAGGHGRALHEYLSRRFGDNHVFFDRSTIESGDVFPDKLRCGVEGCAVLLALIGPEWLSDDGCRRLHDVHDFVRREIALALEQGKKVIPVLFDDTPIPARDRLPASLAALASCDALTLRGKTYEYQTQRQELVRLLANVPGVPPPRAEVGEAVPRQLPSDLPDFTGREQEIVVLERALGGEGGRAAIGGMGGVGKTELAVHVMHRLAARHPDGQIVVDLKGTTEPLSPTAAMGQVIIALDAARKLPHGEGELAGLYRSLLAGKRLLILFDNAADAAQVRELLPAPPAAAIVTSRRAVVLPGLQQVSLDVLAPEEADALLLRIIGEGRAALAERAMLAQSCGYLPLALRVAGTFLVSYPDWGVAEYLTELADERGRLRRLRIEGDPLFDVAAVLGLSLRQLACDRPELVERWRTLAVFADGFDRKAAAAVWAVAPAETRDGLSLFAERSMLLFDGAKQRYRMHDLMRDLALGGVEPLSEEEKRLLEEARDRHSGHYQRLLAEANGLFVQGGEGVVAGLARFDQERANIEAGWRWLQGQADDEAVARRRRDYVAAGYAAGGVLPLRQHPSVQIEWLKTALAAARRLRNRQSEGAVLSSLGNAHRNLGEHRRAIEFFEQSLSIAREIGNRAGEGNTLGNLGTAYFSLGEHRRAIELFEQDLAIAREIGDRRGEGSTLGNLGLAYRNLGEHRRAIEFLEQSLAIVREIGDRRGEGSTLGNLGTAYGSLGKYRRAIEFLEQTLAVAREIGYRRGEGSTLGNLGTAYLRLGEHRRAIELFEQSLAIAREIGDREGEGNSLFNAALALGAMGARTEAIARMREAAAIFTAIESPNVAAARTRLATWQVRARFSAYFGRLAGILRRS